MLKKKLILCAAILIGTVSLHAFDLVNASSPKGKIIIGSKAAPEEKFAAREFQQAIKKISGVKLSIAEDGKAAANDVIIGTAATCRAVNTIAGKLGLGTGKADKIAVYNLDGKLYLAGNSPRGALYAVYTYLDKELGVKWLWPEEDGSFYPQKKIISVKDGLAINQEPALKYRGYRVCPTNSEETTLWMGRNRMNLIKQSLSTRKQAIDKTKAMGFITYLTGHNVKLPKNLLKTHPEYFALISGKRNAAQLCWSNGKAAELVAEKFIKILNKQPGVERMSLSVKDNTQSCQCDTCKGQKCNDLIFGFAGKICEAIKKVHPEVKIGIYAYSRYIEPPQQKIPFDYVELCLYGRCYRHKFDKPDCKGNISAKVLIRKWQKMNVPLLVFGYEFDMFLPKHEFVNLAEVFADQAAWLEKNKFSGYATEIFTYRVPPRYAKNFDGQPFWKSYRWSLYVNTRLLWNPREPIDKILDDWCRHAYGPAANPLKNYYMMMGKAWSNAKADISYVCNPPSSAVKGYIDDKLVKKADSLFKEARQKIGGYKDSKQKDFYLKQLNLEAKQFAQWKRQFAAYNSIYSHSTIEIPLFAENAVGSNFSKSSLWKKAVPFPDFLSTAGKKVKTQRTDVFAFATTDALYLKAVCYDNAVDKLRAIQQKRDSNVWSDECLEIFTTSKALVPGEYIHMAVNPLGTKYDARGLGGMSFNKNWNSDWEVKTTKDTKSWTVYMKIPSRDFALTFKPGEELKFSIVRSICKRKSLQRTGFPLYAVHSLPSMGVLKFVAPGQVPEKRIVLFSGGYKPDSFATELALNNWRVKVADNEADLTKAIQRGCPVIFIKSGKKRLPYRYYLHTVAPAVKNGALLVLAFSGYYPDFKKWFNAPELNIDSGAYIPRRTKSIIAPGAWSNTPHQLLKTMERQNTGYGYATNSPQWEKLAAGKDKNGKSFYFLMITKYGKGSIVLTSAGFVSGGKSMFARLDAPNGAKFLDNLYYYCKKTSTLMAD